MSSMGIIVAATVGIVAIAGLGIASYVAGPNLSAKLLAQPSPSPTPIETPTPTPTPSPSPETASPLPSPMPAMKAQVQGITTHLPTPTPSPIPTPKPKQTIPSPAESNVSLNFIDTPSQVKAGESFKVSWQVTGPAGTRGENSRLQLNYEVSKQEGGSSSSVSSNNSTSYGSFTAPKTFSSTFSFGKESAQLHLTATADVGGQTLTANKTIELTN